MRARFTVMTVSTILAVGVLTTASTATADERAAPVAVVVGQTGTAPRRAHRAPPPGSSRRPGRPRRSTPCREPA